MTDWRPIEIAPKDGTWVLITGGAPSTDSWYGDGPITPMVVAMWLDGWVFDNWDGDYRSEYIGPTHWMPLPTFD